MSRTCFYFKDTEDLNDSYTIHPALYPEFWTQQTKITFLVKKNIGYRISDRFLYITIFLVIKHDLIWPKCWHFLSSSPSDQFAQGQVVIAWPGSSSAGDLRRDGRDFSDPKRGQAPEFLEFWCINLFVNIQKNHIGNIMITYYHFFHDHVYLLYPVVWNFDAFC